MMLKSIFAAGLDGRALHDTFVITNAMPTARGARLAAQPETPPWAPGWYCRPRPAVQVLAAAVRARRACTCVWQKSAKP